jgi:hypothetical protein
MDTFIISGKILHKESGNGIADLLVELFDIDSLADPESGDSTVIARDAAGAVAPTDISNLYKMEERVGSVYTDASGNFRFDITTKDFNLPRKTEQKPDLVLLVLAPEEPGLDLKKRLLHFSRDVRFNAGSKEAYIIRLPTALLKEKEIHVDLQKEESQETTKNKVSLYVNERKREQEFNAGVADFHGAEAVRESRERKVFRKDFIKQIATDFSTVPVRGVFAAEGDNIRDKNIETFHNGVIKANGVLGGTHAQGVPVNLYLTPADKDRLKSYFNSASGEYVDVPDADVQDLLFRTNSTENPGTLLIHNNPIASFCTAESEDEKCAKWHTDIPHEHEEPEPTISTTVSADTITDNDVLTYIDRLVRDLPAPDLVLRPELANKRKDKDVDAAVNEFSLQKGPAEVPAFYDFNSVQIAFDHVWRQLFDETIPNLAYTANTLGKARFGINGIVSDAFKNGLLTADIFCTISPVEVPTMAARFFDITKEEFNEMSFGNRQQLVAIANQIDECTVRTVIYPTNPIMTLTHTGSKITDLRMIQSLTEQGERLIDGVRHDDYHTLHKTLRDLHARLSGKYEFTVFAADKDYHSVNFGLMNTYRQQWTPLNYQAGKLVKTIPLSPKEERKYAVKLNRHEKRSSKEAKKNNSSITNEQSSTSRVEADIMAKAQNKTTFGMTAEGDFNLGVYEGKGTTTFGVEAISESSQNRKDFREAVLKAVQDYKNETSLEVTTDSDFSSESNESGTIVNPNDELAVTYLFYELQKRYRFPSNLP